MKFSCKRCLMCIPIDTGVMILGFVGGFGFVLACAKPDWMRAFIRLPSTIAFIMVFMKYMPERNRLFFLVTKLIEYTGEILYLLAYLFM